MKVESFVRDVVVLVDGKNREYAMLTVETENPLEIHQIRLFGRSIEDGTVKRLQTHTGHKLILPLQVDVFNNKAQLQLAQGSVIQARMSSADKKVAG